MLLSDIPHRNYLIHYVTNLQICILAHLDFAI